MKNENIKKNRILTAFVVICAAVVAYLAFIVLTSDNLGKTYTLDDYESKEFVGNVSEYVKLSVDVEGTDVEVITSDSEHIKISYYNMDKDYYTISTVAGEIKMTYTNELGSGFIGSIFGYSIPKKKVTVELPKTVSMDMDYNIKYGDAAFHEIVTDKGFMVTTDSVEATLQNVTASEMNIEARYGELKLEDIKVNTALHINGDETRFAVKNVNANQFVFYNKEGKLNMEKVQSETVKCDTDSVTINFSEMDSDNVTMTAKYGSITGFFAGSDDDYTVTSNVKDGKNNLSDFNGIGDRTINITADSASVDISFEE